jgi:hypothetical protein
MAADRNAAPTILPNILNLLLEHASEYKCAVSIWFPFRVLRWRATQNEKAEQNRG